MQGQKALPLWRLLQDFSEKGHLASDTCGTDWRLLFNQGDYSGLPRTGVSVLSWDSPAWLITYLQLPQFNFSSLLVVYPCSQCFPIPPNTCPKTSCTNFSISPPGEQICNRAFLKKSKEITALLNPIREWSKGLDGSWSSGCWCRWDWEFGLKLGEGAFLTNLPDLGIKPVYPASLHLEKPHGQRALMGYSP